MILPRATIDSAWFQRLILKCDELLSNFAFKLKLRRFRQVMPELFTKPKGENEEAGVDTRPLFSST